MENITVFTPTYNRAKTLHRLYESLCMQKDNNFEWLIVDDGSDDCTEEIVQKWIQEHKINVRYHKKANEGKHTAINLGVELAHGKYFFICDSDDYLVDDAIQKIEYMFSTIGSQFEKYAGVSGIKVHSDGSMIGDSFVDKEYVDCTSLDRNMNNIRGDKSEVFFLSVLKQYPFPIFKGEKFLNEAVVWNRIAKDGLMIRWFNQPLIVCEYREDGLTSQKGILKYKNPKGTLLYLEELTRNDKKFFCRIAHRASFCGLAKGIYSNKEICKRIKIPILLIPLYRFIYKVRGTN